MVVRCIEKNQRKCVKNKKYNQNPISKRNGGDWRRPRGWMPPGWLRKGSREGMSCRYGQRGWTGTSSAHEMCSVCSRGDGHPHRFIHKWVESWRTRAAGRPALFSPPSTSVDLVKAARATDSYEWVRLTHAHTHPPILLLLLLVVPHCHSTSTTILSHTCASQRQDENP